MNPKGEGVVVDVVVMMAEMSGGAVVIANDDEEKMCEQPCERVLASVVVVVDNGMPVDSARKDSHPS